MISVYIRLQVLCIFWVNWIDELLSSFSWRSCSLIWLLICSFQLCILSFSIMSCENHGKVLCLWCFGKPMLMILLLVTLLYCRNYNYGAAGKALNVDLLNHPEYLEQNATLAFMAAMSKWMTPLKKSQPSAHEIFVGEWKPTKNDTLAKRVPGFGATMNILYGEMTCGQGDIDAMNTVISHYLYYLDLMGVGREEAGPQEVLSCAEQLAFNPATAPPAASSS